MILRHSLSLWRDLVALCLRRLLTAVGRSSLWVRWLTLSTISGGRILLRDSLWFSIIRRTTTTLIHSSKLLGEMRIDVSGLIDMVEYMRLILI